MKSHTGHSVYPPESQSSHQNTEDKTPEKHTKTRPFNAETNSRKTPIHKTRENH